MRTRIIVAAVVAGLTVRVRASDESAPAIGLAYDLTATLCQPLGTRQVLDGATGQPIPRLPD